MKNKKKFFVLIESALAVMVFMLAVVIFQEKNGKDFSKVSVIIQNSDDSQWSAFKYGLKMAAEDQKMDLFIVSTSDTLSMEEELEIIQRELEYGADALIVQPVLGSYPEELLKEKKNKIPIMLVESIPVEENELSTFPVVEPDHYAMGRSLAEELLKDYDGNLKGKKLGIVSESEGSSSVLYRRKGFEDAIKGTGAKILWSVFGAFEENENNSLNKQPWVDIMVALDDNSLTAAGEYSAAGNLHGALVYGIGHSTESAYYLDTGRVECLIVPDEFYAGYQSLTQIAETIRSYFHVMSSQTVSYTIIRRDELFTDKNQEILFTMSQ